MDTRSDEIKNAFRTNGLIQKTVANFVTVFFIFSGSSAPISFAASGEIILNERQQATPVQTLAQANAQAPAAAQLVSSPLPSGAAIQNGSPLSLGRGSLQTDGNPSPAGVSPQEAKASVASAEINLPMAQNVFASSSPNPGATVKVNAEGLSINFSGSGTTAYSGEGGINYDNAATSGVKETVDLSGFGKLTMGLRGFVHVGTNAGGNYSADSVWLTIESKNGKSASVLLSGIVASQENVISVDLNKFFGVDLKTVSVVRFSVDGYNVAGTWLDVRAFSKIPQGWIGTASNPNYAFQEQPAPDFPKSGMLLSLMDLRNGSVKQIAGPTAYYESFRSVDVSADNKFVVFCYGTNPLMPGYTATTVVKSLLSLSKSVVFQERLDGVTFTAGIVTLNLSARQVRVNLATFEVLVPQGWACAASNKKFAFQSQDMIGAYQQKYSVLKVQNLLTGAVQELYALQSPPSSYTKMDVSSDGQLVYFGAQNNYTSPLTGWLRVQQVNDATKKTDIMGVPSKVSFTTQGDVSVTILTSFLNGTQLESLYVVDRARVQSTFSNTKLVKQGSAVLDEGYLIIPVQISYSNTYEVTIYDASGGTSQLVRLSAGILYPASQSAGGSSGSGSYTKIDAYKTPEGRKLIAIGILAAGNSNVDYSQTFILDPRTGEKLALKGAVTAITYSGHDATYTLRSFTGTTSQVKVDLSTLQVVQPLPVGWTYAPSNKYFAFRSVVYEQTNVRLEMIDLRDPSKVMIVGGGSLVRHNPTLYDVSPDGKILVVAHQESGPVVGQLSDIAIYRIADLLPGVQPAGSYKKYIPTANAKSIRFLNGYVVITATVRGPTYATDSKTQIMTYNYSISELLK